MKRVGTIVACGLVAAAGIAMATACGSSSSDGAGGSGAGDAQAGGEGGNGGGDDGGLGGDTSTVAPYAGGDVTVSFTDGDGGAVTPTAVTGAVTIHMVPATPAAIAKIEALVDGKVVGTVSKAPYDVAWDSTTVPNGAHVVSARAYDLAGATKSSADLPITTSNFLLAGTWKYSGVTDGTAGFGTDSCSDTTFTVTFNQQTSTMTLPKFNLSCRAQNNAPYTSTINGFSKVLTPADYGGPIMNKTGTVTTTFSSTMLTQSDSFNNDTQSGKLTKMP